MATTEGDPPASARLVERLAEALIDWPSTDGMGSEHLPDEGPPFAAHVVAHLDLHVVPDERWCVTHQALKGYCGFGDRNPPVGPHVYRHLVAIDLA